MFKIDRSLVTAFILALVLSICTLGYAEVLIDDFNKSSNRLGGRTSVYQRAPSRALAIQSPSEHYGAGGKGLMIKFDKKGTGGPYGMGGWCGYYTLLKKGDKHFDATSYKNLSFYVKGVKGDENFKVGLADRHWDKIGDSVKSEEIGNYLPGGKITTDWQKATVPLDAFFLDFKELASIAICFETDCFPGGEAKGTVYIDNLMLE
jgi:hypothetical protein